MMKPIVLIVLIALITVNADDCKGQGYGKSGEFDFYVFAQSWSAGWCANGHTSIPGCTDPTDYQRANLTLHGMWPNYAQSQDGHNWPQCCPSKYDEQLSPTVVKNLLTYLQELWPNEQDPSGKNIGNSLWQHEWGKHGTCSGLDQESYFEAAMNLQAQVGTPSAITSNIGGSVKLSDLYAAYNATSCHSGSPCLVGFSCDGHGSLNQVITCWNQQYKQVPCPASTVSGKSCKDSVSITKFK